MAGDNEGRILSLQTASSAAAWAHGAPVALDASGNVVLAADAALNCIGFVESALPALSAAALRRIAIRCEGVIEVVGIAHDTDGGNDTTIGPGDYLVCSGTSQVKRVVHTTAYTVTQLNLAHGQIVGQVVEGDVTGVSGSDVTGTVKMKIMRM